MDRAPAMLVLLLVLLTACGSSDTPAESTASTEGAAVASEESSGGGADGDPEVSSDEGATELFPDVVGVEAVHDGDGSWTFRVTLSSPYDSPERYADAWRVVGPDGTVFGERVLLHDHAAEQPFTRSQSGIEIPAEVGTVTVEGRDQVSGWGGATMDVTLER